MGLSTEWRRVDTLGYLVWWRRMLWDGSMLVVLRKPGGWAWQHFIPKDGWTLMKEGPAATSEQARERADEYARGLADG